MKITPEQKAFYEYGQARGILKERKELMISMEGEFDAAIYYPEYRELYHIEEAIRDAWQKRAACRAWMIRCSERTSKNCIHGSKSRYEMPCRECFRSAYALQSEMVGDNWEPRKEGES